MGFGNRIKKCRLNLGLTQQELADKLSVNKSTISLYETDKRSPDNEKLIQLSQLFKVSIDYLLGNDDYENNKIKTSATDLADVIKGSKILFNGKLINVNYDLSNNLKTALKLVFGYYERQGNMVRENYLKDLIKEKGTVKDFAKKIDMPYTTLLSILKNVGGASIDNITKICEGLGITIDQLNNYNNPNKFDLKYDLINLINDKEILYNGKKIEMNEKMNDKLKTAIEFVVYENKSKN